MVMHRNCTFVIAVSCSLVVVACGKKKKTGTSVTAQLALQNSTGASLVDSECPDLGGGYHPDQCWTPTAYGLKILQVDISPDAEGAHSAPAGLIWGNTACAMGTGSMDIDGKSYDYDSLDGHCSYKDIADYFELARSSSEVNTALNSQQHKILPGVYNYVQIEFCNGGTQPEAPNARFLADGMTEPFEARSTTCAVHSVAANPPIVVAEGESVKISLTYDLTNIISSSSDPDPTKCYVSADKSVTRCFSFPLNMTPSISRQ